MIKKILFITLMFSFTLSCKKDEIEQYPDTPQIEFVSMTPQTTTEFQDQIIVTIAYKDGNGDIGTEDPDDYNLFVKDKRLSNYDEYHIQPLSPIGEDLQIEGELNVVLTGMFILDTNNTAETTSFKIKLKDRAGNYSNEVETTNLKINKSQ